MTCKSWIIGVALAALFWAGCETPGPKEQFVCVDDEVRIGDTLTISLLDIPEPQPDKDFVVRGDGTVNLPLLGATKAAGKKFADFEREVQDAYIKGKFYNRVTVIVKAGFRFYTVAGEVVSPQRQVYQGQTTLLRAIATCGDFTEFANRRRVEITRANGKKEIVDCKKAQRDSRYDRPICPGDYIFVPRTVL